MEKLIITENDNIWFMKHKDQVSLYQKDDSDDVIEFKLSREDKLQIIKFLIDTL